MKIPYGRQDINDSDINAVIEVLKSSYLTQGPTVPRFENCVKNYCKANHAIAVNSATSALHIALLALEVGPGDFVWTSPNTFVASANAALYCGAHVDFVDIDENTYNMSVEALTIKLEQAYLENKLPKVIIPVHLSGQSCDMEAINKLAKKYSFKIVEDASHAIGGNYKNMPIGNCQFSDITVFSFHPVKIITTAEGGMALTNDCNLANRLQLFRSHGVTRDPNQMTKEMDGPWYYQQIELGYNYRMSDIQAALGISQMDRLDEYIRRRHEIASRYNHELEDLPAILPFQPKYSYSAYHLYILRLKLNEIEPLTQKMIFEKLHAKGILVNLHYIPVHTHPFYQRLGFKFGDFPNSENYYSQSISIPMYPSLSNTEQSRVIQILKTTLNKRR
jgi:UDP-4-amino-4,6-dideoxy-N-acetyl-beta-L-altrosamine transaminase